MLGVIYGVLLWADMNAATPLVARGRSVMSLDGAGKQLRTVLDEECMASDKCHGAHTCTRTVWASLT